MEKAKSLMQAVRDGQVITQADADAGASAGTSDAESAAAADTAAADGTVTAQ